MIQHAFPMRNSQRFVPFCLILIAVKTFTHKSFEIKNFVLADERKG